jgi:hypothetical protein
MRSFATMPTLDIWYSRLDIDDMRRQWAAAVGSTARKRFERNVAKARARDSLGAFAKLTHIVDGEPRILASPPLIMPVEDLLAEDLRAPFEEAILGLIQSYRDTLAGDRRRLLDRFRYVHLARKVVGVGSVGTRAWIVLMETGDGVEPLFLQAKEAQTSVLADYCGRSQYNNEGERVVAGQHLMQAQSDIFLGWTHVTGVDGVDRDYYVRQLRDWKFSLPIEQMLPQGMTAYARLCGWTLARGHACSGDRVAVAAYLGGSTKFDKAIAEFAETYADQNERDYAALQTAVKNGEAEATPGI